MKKQRLLPVGACALLLMAWSAQAADWWETIKIKGYVQTDFYIQPETRFDLRRGRLAVEGQLTEQDYVQLQMDTSIRDNETKVKLQDAFLTHSFNDEFSARLGYTAHMVSWEGPYSSSGLPWMERSYPSGKFDPGEQELGLLVTRSSQRAWDPTVMISYGNGLQSWYDRGADDGEALLARVDLPFGEKSLLGVSYRSAWQQQEGDPRLSEDCFNVHLVYNHPGSGLSLWSEYYDGEVRGVAADGLYAGLIYKVPDQPFRVYYRYDTYGQEGADDYGRHVAGVNYFLTSNQTITAELGHWTQGDDSDTTLATRWQIKY